MSRLRERYQAEVVPALTKEFGYTNVMAVPKLGRIVVNMGLGAATQNSKLIDVGSRELTLITGQKPVVRRARKSVAQFKVRQGMPIGTMVTLRGGRCTSSSTGLCRSRCRASGTSGACRPMASTAAATTRWD